MNTLQITVLGIHLILISITGYVLFFSNNVVALTVGLLCLIITYVQLLFYGCVLNKYVDKIPFINMTIIEIAKKCFSLSNNIDLCDFEKIFVGFTLASYLGKIGVLVFMFPSFKNKLDFYINYLASCIVPSKYSSYSFWKKNTIQKDTTAGISS